MDRIPAFQQPSITLEDFHSNVDCEGSVDLVDDFFNRISGCTADRGSQVIGVLPDLNSTPQSGVQLDRIRLDRNKKGVTFRMMTTIHSFAPYATEENKKDLWYTGDQYKAMQTDINHQLKLLLTGKRDQVQETLGLENNIRKLLNEFDSQRFIKELLCEEPPLKKQKTE